MILFSNIKMMLSLTAVKINSEEIAKGAILGEVLGKRCYQNRSNGLSRMDLVQ